MTTFSIHKGRFHGFTLTELLMVIFVVTILLSLSLPVIRIVTRHTSEAVAKSELKSVEGAWKQYYAHYGNWPVTNADADVSMKIDRRLYEILAGTEDDQFKSNPDKLAFMEFARIDDDDVPLNIWGASRRFEKARCVFHVAFDTTGDNRITFPSNNASWTALKKLRSGVARRGVIVWTFNPEVKSTDPAYLIGSWEE